MNKRTTETFVSKNCDHFVDGTCLIATNEAGVRVTVDSKDCARCQRDASPRQRNRTTLILTIRARAQKGLSVSANLTDEVALLQASKTATSINHKRSSTYGPGTELKKMLSWFSTPSNSCQCEEHAALMNEWGASGCRANQEIIIDWLLEEANHKGIPGGSITRRIAKSLVLTAIRRFERKFPDGAPNEPSG